MAEIARREIVRSVGLLLGVAAIVATACGHPDSFDNLTGGPEAGPDGAVLLRADPSLAPPRPLGPLSASWVNSRRPRLRWEATAPIVGARVELCPTRPEGEAPCEGAKKTFEANGDVLIIPEDLTPGVWFWRLYGKTTETYGTKPSATWEVFVRGPAAAVTKDNPAADGTVADPNGDGVPDLFLAAVYTLPLPVIDVVAALGTQGDPTTFGVSDAFGIDYPTYPLTGADTSVATTDIDGDGYPDLVAADRLGSSEFGILVVPGAASGFDRDRARGTVVPKLEETPYLREVGDLDGDGWGDVALTTKKVSLTAFGTPRGLGATSYFRQFGFGDLDAGPESGAPRNPLAPLAMTAGHAWDDDPYSDVVFAEPFGTDPIALVTGYSERLLGSRALRFESPVPGLDLATRLTAGDFNDDGRVDVAFVAAAGNGKPVVCVAPASPTDAVRLSCWTPEDRAAGFGSDLIAADLLGDGHDVAIVGSTTEGVFVLRLEGTVLTAEHLPALAGASLTTIYPGRPGPAIWAGLPADGSRAEIHRGKEAVRSLPLPSDATSFRRFR